MAPEILNKIMPRAEFKNSDQREAFHWWKMAKLEDPKNKTLGPLSEDPRTSVYEIDGEDLIVHQEDRSGTHFGMDYVVISENHVEDIRIVYRHYQTRTKEQKEELYRNPQPLIDAIKSGEIFKSEESDDPSWEWEANTTEEDTGHLFGIPRRPY